MMPRWPPLINPCRASLGGHRGGIPQGHHHVRGHGVRPHADDVAAPALHRRGRGRPVGRRRPRPERPSSTCTLVIRRTAARPPIPRSSWSTSRRSSPRPTPSSASPAAAAPGCRVADRLRVIYETKPELCTLNLGTFNYGSFPMIGKYAGKWKFGWEEPYLESTRTEPFVSTFADIEHMLTHRRPDHRRPLRVRGLRRRPPLHAGVLPRRGTGEAADLPADDHGRDGRHRRRGRAPRAHEGHRRPAVRRRAAVVGAGRWPASVQHDHRLRRDGLARPGRAGGRPVHRQGPGSRSPTPSRSPRSCASSASCRSTSRPQPMPARSSGSRASTRLAGERGRLPPHPRPPAPSPSSARASSEPGGRRISCGWGMTSSRGTLALARTERLTALVESAWPALERLGLRPGCLAATGCGSPTACAEAVADAAFRPGVRAGSP